MLTLSIIKADTGGFVGHSSVHPRMVDEARGRVELAKGSLLIDRQVATCGDDLSSILTHRHGAEDEAVHRFAFDLFMATTDIAAGVGLHGAGQDLISDAFNGNPRSQANDVFDYLRWHGPFEPHRLPLDEMEYTIMPAVSAPLADRWESVEAPAVPAHVPGR